jgi:hypothetical protein
MSQAIDAVLAGTKGFAVALLAPLTARIGNRPRVAGDPSQVLGLCGGPSSLAVVEFMGEGSLPLIQALVRDGRGLRIVAGVPAAHAAAEGTLRALGVEVGRWDGKTEGVISAVDRAVASIGGAPAPASVRPAVPAPARAPAPAVTRPAAGTQPTGAKPSMPGPSPAARPAAPPAASAARPGAAPAPTAPRPAAAPPAAAARPGGSGAPAFWPASPAPSAAQPGLPVPQPARPQAPAQAHPPGPRNPPASVAAAPQPARPPANFFADLDTDVSVDIGDFGAASAPSVDFHASGVYVPPPSAAANDWPGATITPAQAEDALKRAIRGSADPAQPLHALALRTLETLSPVERAVLAGEPQPIDAAPVRKAAVMRLRVAEALASAPPPGSTVDQAALSSILGEIDGLLAEVAPLLAAAPPQLAPALESVRNALVREAIDFSEAGQRVATSAPAAPSPPPAAAARPSSAKVLSIASEQAMSVETADRRKTWTAVVVLALVCLAAIGYHGWRQYTRREIRPPATLPGAPSNTIASGGTGNVQLVISKTGKFDPAELDRFRSQEEIRGNQVEQISPGVLKVTRGSDPQK